MSRTGTRTIQRAALLAALGGLILAGPEAAWGQRISLRDLQEQIDALAQEIDQLAGEIDAQQDLESGTAERDLQDQIDEIGGGSLLALSANMGLSEDDIPARLPLVLEADDATIDQLLPFPVVFDGVAYQEIRISSNGWIEFNGNTGSSLLNFCLPTGSQARFGPFVAAYWDDLVSTVRAGTVGAAPNRVFIVYFDARTFANNENTDFQVQIHEGSSLINVKYHNMAPGAVGQGATIGFQLAGSFGGGRAYPIGCNAAVLDDNADDADPGHEGWSIAPVR